MRAFEVSVNGQKLCVAGIGDDGVLSAIVHLAVRQGEGGVFLQVGGLYGQSKEHLDWISQKPLNVGDGIQIRIVEAQTIDVPKVR